MAMLPIYDVARSFDSASLTASYQDVGAVMGSPVFGFVIYNNSDVAVQISFDDGDTDGPIIPPNSTFGDNRDNWDGRTENSRYCLPTNAQIQIKQVTAAGTGSIYINVKRRS